MALSENEILNTKQVTTDTTRDLYLAFITDGEHYALDIGNIKEIIGVVPITIIPKTENYIKGIINLRGDIVPVIDVRTRFMKEEIGYTQFTCIVVVVYQEYTLGFIVDSILGVYRISQEMLSNPPSARLSYANQFIKNIGRTDDGIKLLIDLEKLIF